MEKLTKGQIKALILIGGVLLIIVGIWLAAMICYATESFAISFAGVLTGGVLIIVGIVLAFTEGNTEGNTEGSAKEGGGRYGR